MWVVEGKSRRGSTRRQGMRSERTYREGQGIDNILFLKLGGGFTGVWFTTVFHNLYRVRHK